MSRFAAPIAEQIWDMKYRLKEASGTPVDATVEDSWRRVARALAAVEAEPAVWEERFMDALTDFRFLPAGRILAGAGTGRAAPRCWGWPPTPPARSASWMSGTRCAAPSCPPAAAAAP